MNGAGTTTRALDMATCLVRSRTLDTIRAVRRRHDDFNAMRDRIRALGTDNLVHFSRDIELTLPFCRKGALVIFHETAACDDVRNAWIQSIARRKSRPLAEYIGDERPLGITVNSVR
jgi:hypothetical protein